MTNPIFTLGAKRISPNKGKKLSELHKQRIGLALKGRKREPFSEEWRLNMRLAHLGKKRKPFTDVWKHNIQVAQRLRRMYEREYE